VFLLVLVAGQGHDGFVEPAARQQLLEGFPLGLWPGGGQQCASEHQRILSQGYGTMRWGMSPAIPPLVIRLLGSLPRPVPLAPRAAPSPVTPRARYGTLLPTRPLSTQLSPIPPAPTGVSRPALDDPPGGWIALSW